MLEFDVASGQLMTPLPEIRVRRTGYVALLPRRADDRAAASEAFVDWLATKVRSSKITGGGP
jgi:LysR family glycine cleavage system transcriptional activator